MFDSQDFQKYWISPQGPNFHVSETFPSKTLLLSLSKCQELLCNGFSVEDSSKKKDKLGPMVLVPSPSATIILDGTEAWPRVRTE